MSCLWRADGRPPVGANNNCSPFSGTDVSMKGTRVIHHVAVCLAAVGFCFPQIALAATPPNQAPLVTDVRLHKGAVLLGQVVTGEYIPVAGAEVALSSGNQKLATGQTDKGGRFAFFGLRSGVYQVVTADGHGAYRVWTQGTAPPSARPTALIVTGAQTVRGQFGPITVRNLMANPWVIAGIVATAVAVPVAIHNANRPTGSPN